MLAATATAMASEEPTSKPMAPKMMHGTAPKTKLLDLSLWTLIELSPFFIIDVGQHHPATLVGVPLEDFQSLFPVHITGHVHQRLVTERLSHH